VWRSGARFVETLSLRAVVWFSGSVRRPGDQGGRGGWRLVGVGAGGRHGWWTWPLRWRWGLGLWSGGPSFSEFECGGHVFGCWAVGFCEVR
jgi:hypothetical protein